MFYKQSITVPPLTPESTPVEIDMPICNGVIHRVEIEFEKWCANLLHIRILRFRQQIFPSTPAEWFEADGETISWNDYFEVFEEPYTLHVQGWSQDDFFEWTARVRVGILPRTIAEHVYGRLTPVDRKKLRQAFGLLPEVK